MTYLMSVPTIPVFMPITAAQAQCLERAVNVRVGMDGDREVYQVVGGVWTEIPDTSLPPSLCDVAGNASAYFKYAYSVSDATYYA